MELSKDIRIGAFRLPKPKAEARYSDAIFRAYDIRGKYPDEINEKIISQIIFSFISKIKNQSASWRTKIKIVIGRDARLSSPKLYRATIKSVRYQMPNARIVAIGLATTPMFYFLAKHFNADIGIMITASHNPKEYNGLKIVGKNAVPISGKDILKKIQNSKIKNQNDKSKIKI